MYHHKNLSACDVTSLSCALLGFRLLVLVAEQVRVTWDTLHKSLEEERVETDEAA